MLREVEDIKKERNVEPELKKSKLQLNSRPKSKWLYFLKIHRSSMMKENPTMNFKEVALALAKKYRNLSVLEQEELIAAFQMEPSVYHHNSNIHTLFTDNDSTTYQTIFPLVPCFSNVFITDFVMCCVSDQIKEYRKTG